VRLERRTLDGDPVALASELRGLVPVPATVHVQVRQIIEDVVRRGDEAVLELTRKYDTHGAEPKPLLVAPPELDKALAALDRTVRDGLDVAIANVRAVAEADINQEQSVVLPQGQRVVLRDVPVRRVAVYVPGGRAPYPSTVVMGVVTARTAGVGEVAVCSPPGLDAEIHPTILAACALTGVDEVYRMGGAQAVTALAQGTETVRQVDVIVGPGNLWVQEAKRQVMGVIGLDGFAGPSDLLALLSGGAEVADVTAVALDLRAQGEHGADSLVIAVSPDTGTLDAVAEALADAPEPGVCALVQTADLDAALVFAEEFAPEHLQLIGSAAEALAPRVARAGCLFVGVGAATAFGDYVAGSNHTLPTEGTAHFASGLSVRTFRRRMAEVRIPPEAAAALAPHGAAIARAEGFETHAESMEARIRENGAR
jgi:histidinol dehydrogenase